MKDGIWTMKYDFHKEWYSSSESKYVQVLQCEILIPFPFSEVNFIMPI